MPSGAVYSGRLRRSSMIPASVSAASSTCLSGSAALGREDRHEPVHVRMRQPRDQPAGSAGAAGLIASPLAEDQLGQPERQALLSHPCRSGEQEDLGQGTGTHRPGQTAPGFLVPDEGGQWHGEKVRCGGRKDSMTIVTCSRTMG